MDRWYRNGVIYSLDIETFQDSDDDGVGDLCGLADRLDYLGRLGVDTIWLNPCHPSPRRDGGYDITDYYGIDPRFGTLGDFAELVSQADEVGIRIVLDLVVNHTSDEHPWFLSALSGREAPHHDWYVWADHEPADRWDGGVFPGSEEETWTYAETVGRWYRHRFYRFQPELDVEHPAVQAELAKIVTFWLRLGVAGFRIDAAPFLIESRGRRDFGLLRRLRETASWQRGDAILLAEANVPEDELLEYFGTADDEASRATMLFDFRLNQALMLGLARDDAEPVRERLRRSPRLPGQAQWATFLRNHDEVDLSGLSPEERGDVLGRFGPEPHMQLYDRGIRRRLACMLDGDRRRLELAYSLLLTMPGSPVLRYGDEIGMGEDLALPERTAIRTPMQWSDGPNSGFSRAPAGQLVAPLVEGGPFGYDPGRPDSRAARAGPRDPRCRRRSRRRSCGGRPRKRRRRATSSRSRRSLPWPPGIRCGRAQPGRPPDPTATTASSIRSASRRSGSVTIPSRPVRSRNVTSPSSARSTWAWSFIARVSRWTRSTSGVIRSAGSCTVRSIPWRSPDHPVRCRRPRATSSSDSRVGTPGRWLAASRGDSPAGASVSTTARGRRPRSSSASPGSVRVSPASTACVR